MGGSDNRNVLVRGASGAFAIKVFGAGLALVAQIVLARVLGVEAYGLYTYVTVWMLLLASFTTLGLDRVAVRFVPKYARLEASDALRDFISRSTQLVLIFSILAGLAVFAAISWMHGGDLNLKSSMLVIGTILVPVNAWGALYSQIVRSFKAVVSAEYPNLIVRPTLMILVIAGMVYAGSGEIGVRDVLLINITGGILVIVMLRRSMRRLVVAVGNETQIDEGLRNWIQVALPLLLVAGGNLVLSRTDVIMLGAMSGVADAGLYNAASRLAFLVGFPLLAVNAILAPLAAELTASKERGELQRSVTFATRLALSGTAILAVAVLVLDDILLGLFGSEFTGQTNTLRVLIAAQVLSASLGPVGYLMIIGNLQKSLAGITALVAALNILLNWYLVPRYGAMGAAMSTCVSISISNVAMAVVTVRKLNLNPTAVSFLKTHG